MGILRVDHPDIQEFIACKNDPQEITNFNISVAITDKFMEAVKAESNFELVDPRSGRPFQREGEVVSIEARVLFDDIVDYAWKNGEPGMIFIDRINQLNPTSPSETIEATNPCGEQPLPPYGSCNLGSINLSCFVDDPLPDEFTPSQPESAVDWGKLRAVIRTAVHFLDNVIDQNVYPLSEIEKQSQLNRRIGLGVMGWADMLVQLGLPYNREESFRLAEQLMSFIHEEATVCSSELARTRGRFPNWEGSIYADQQVAMRNATVTTVAPTGTISIIAGCSSGIEPYFAIAYQRNVLDGTRMTEVNPYFAGAAKRGGFFSEKLIRKLLKHRSLSEIDDIPQELRAIFLTSADILPGEHVQMQAAFQKHCDSSVSKTINLAHSDGREKVAEAFMAAYDSGCKGITIYRDGSRPNQVLSTKPAEAAPAADRPVPTETSGKMAERPPVLPGFTEKIRTGYGNMYVTVTVRDGQPFEVFAQIGKSGYSTMADTEAISRLISLLLRSGVDVRSVIRQLRGIGGSSPVFSEGGKVSSIPDAIALVLEKHFGDSTDKSEISEDSEICPDCSSPMNIYGNCFVCRHCGYSTC